MEEKKPAGLYLICEKNHIKKQLVDADGTMLLEETVSPHSDLLRFMDWDADAYHRALDKLEHSRLFEESIDVSVIDFQDIIIDASRIPDAFLKGFPEAHYFTVRALEQAISTPDDGSAMYLLTAGASAVKAAQLTYLTKNRIRNMLEVCFGTTEGFSQQERFEKICTVYPTLRSYSFTSMENGAFPYKAESLFELCAYELMAVLRSEKRIARCQNCWRYFVPRTKKKTAYCYRIWPDGQDCGQKGANLRRFDAPAEDKYLAAHKKLRARFYERDYREYANPTERMGTPYETYWNWSDIAIAARCAYLSGEIDGEELLRRINPDGEPIELDEIERDEPLPLCFDWRERMERNIDFNPDRLYEGFMSLDLNKPTPKWQVLSPKEQSRAAKGTDISLREKYRKGE